MILKYTTTGERDRYMRRNRSSLKNWKRAVFLFLSAVMTATLILNAQIPQAAARGSAVIRQLLEEGTSDGDPGEGSSADAGSFTGQHSAVWMNGTSNYSITDGSSHMHSTPSSNRSQATVTAQVNLSFGASDKQSVFGPGDIRIRIPREAIENVSTFQTAVPLAPAHANTHYFNYYIDEATDEIVMTNWADFLGEQAFQATISWSFLPSDVRVSESGTYERDLPVTFELTRHSDDGTETVETSTDILKLSVKTDAKISRAQKLFYAKYDHWQNSWGTAPEDADEYFYAVWECYWIAQSSNTQPYRIVHEEFDEADVVGWWEGVTNVAANEYPPSYFQIKAPFKPIGTNPEICQIKPSTPTYSKDGVSYMRPDTYMSVATGALFVMTRYKKSDYKAGDTITNTDTMVLHGMDSALDQKTVSGSFVYYPEGEEPYAGDLYNVDKFWQNYKTFSYRQILADDPYTWSTNVYLTGEARGYSLTRDAGSGKYGVHPYTVEMADDYIEQSVGGIVGLEPGDYYFSTITYSASWYNKDPRLDNTASVVSSKAPDLWIKSPSNPEWHLVRNGSTAVAERAYAVRFSTTGTGMYVRMNATLKVTLCPTDHVKGLINARINAGGTYFAIRNYTTLEVKDDQGRYHSTVNKNDYNKRIASDDRKIIRARDDEEYGTDVWPLHDYASNSLSDYPTHTNTTKSSQNLREDKANSCYKIDYLLLRQHYVEHDGRYTTQNFLDQGAVEEYRNTVFYDLLPDGASLAEGSVVAYRATGATLIAPNTTHTAFWVPKQALDASLYTVETIANWRGSGRTMLIVRINIPEDQTIAYTARYNGNSSEFDTGTGLLVGYTLDYPWSSILDYGQTVTNNFVFFDADRVISGGRTDDGYNRPYLDDLDGSGTAGDMPRSYAYSDNTYDNVPLMGVFETGYTKTVRSFEQDNFGEEAAVKGNGLYEYRLRLGVEPTGGNVKNVVFFDVLEEMYGDNQHWKGTFDSVDTAAAEKKGCNVIVYYSTEDLDAYAPDTWQDLTDTGIWTTAVPEDKSQVKAVAFDLSKRKDGSNFVMKPGESIMVKIRMQAPADVAPYVDPDIYAYNASYIRNDMWTDAQNESEAVRIMERANTVRVKPEEPLTIDKSSDHGIGTAEEPETVSLGETLTYTLTIHNENTAEPQKEVVAVDNIPEGLELVQDGIKVAEGTRDAVPVGDQENVSVQIEGQKIQMTIHYLPADGKITISIPTTVMKETFFENTSQINELDGHEIDIPSNPTDHETDTCSIEVCKQWVGKTAGEVTIRLYSQIADEDPIATGDVLILSEENEYQGAFEHLPRRNEEGAVILYSIKEDEIAGYTSTIDGNAEDGFVVINTKDEVPPNVDTGDHFRMLPFIMVMVFSGVIAAGIGCLIYIRKKREYDHV